MVKYNEYDHPTVCIFGTKLEGNLHKASIQKTFVKIFSFFCEVKEYNVNCENKMKSSYNNLSPLDCGIGASMSGRRGIVEPPDGYNGVDLITKKKPKKVTTHNSLFLVNGLPAICYFDTLESRERPIKLSTIQLS